MKVSVLMPVYNGAAFLREAIDSILNQSFTDFEFLILDDGSTDDSAAIIQSYEDPRIRLVRNGKNLGLIATLNRGIELVSGDYVARMDCDDISLPARLAKQAAFLDANPAFALVAVKTVFIDADDRECGSWNDDQNYTTCDEIAGRLPRANCIAHPGIMIRKSILESYRYNSRQRNAEDYDLWLRLVADNVKIGKISENLLKYRLTDDSVTAVSNRKYPDFKNVRTKSIFLWGRLEKGRLNRFMLLVFLNIFKDLYYLVAKTFCEIFSCFPPKPKR